MNARFLLIMFVAGVLFAEANAQWTSTQGPNTGIVRRIAVTGQNRFAAVDTGGVFVSTGSGTTWYSVNTGLTNHSVWALCVNGSSIYAGTNGGGAYVSTDNGASWTQTNNGITGTFVHSIVASGSNVFAGTDSGVYLSSNNGTNWIRVNSGLPTKARVHSLTVSTTSLLAGTDSFGVWQRPLSELVTSVEQTSAEIAAHYNLGQNYPNPFNPTTTIRYIVGGAVTPRGAHPSAAEGSAFKNVKLGVYDLLGREVAVLVNEKKAPGNYEVQFDG